MVGGWVHTLNGVVSLQTTLSWSISFLTVKMVLIHWWLEHSRMMIQLRPYAWLAPFDVSFLGFGFLVF